MVSNPTPADLGLKGRKILVIGGAQGLGRATAIWLADLGARVIVADVQDCSETAKACGDAPTLHFDMTDVKSIAPTIADLDANDGPLYGVVNCAGLLLRRKLEDTTDEEIAIQTAVNQTGTFHLARAAMECMQKHGEGRIVLYTSQGAFTGGFNGSIPYGMNKAAIHALIKSLARIGAPDGVTVNAVAPGAADTAMLRSGMTPKRILDGFAQRIPAGRFGTPEELAGATAFLLSSWASYITGTTLHVNGGQYMA